jgi:hypothetical protein
LYVWGEGGVRKKYEDLEHTLEEYRALNYFELCGESKKATAAAAKLAPLDNKLEAVVLS